MSEQQAAMIEVEVAYATPDKQKIIPLKVKAGTTALEAVELSGIVMEFPEIDLASAKLGLFGKVLGSKGLKPANEYEVKDWDRVEIYRPLIADPKEVRRKRAAKAKAQAADDRGNDPDNAKGTDENKANDKTNSSD